MFSGRADRGVARRVKAALHIPVLYNGDVASGADAVAALRDIGCDMLLVGRGAMGNPFLFSEIAAILAGRAYAQPALGERLAALREQAGLAVAEKGEYIAMRELRKHAVWYAGGFRGAAAFRARGSTLSTLTELDAFIRDILAADAEAAPQTEVER